jgi:hypothetical protein
MVNLYSPWERRRLACPRQGFGTAKPLPYHQNRLSQLSCPDLCALCAFVSLRFPRPSLPFILHSPFSTLHSPPLPTCIQRKTYSTIGTVLGYTQMRKPVCYTRILN